MSLSGIEGPVHQFGDEEPEVVPGLEREEDLDYSSEALPDDSDEDQVDIEKHEKAA